MLRKIEFVLHEGSKKLDEIELETSTEPSELLKSLEDFRKIVNESLTKKIEGGYLEDYIKDHVDCSDGEEESVQDISPKKRKM